MMTSVKFIRFLSDAEVTMTVAEQPCYTLINTGQDVEPASEMQLREDLEKGNDKVCLSTLVMSLSLTVNCFS